MIETRFPVASDFEAGSVERLSRLVNEVYDVAESGLWKRKGTRTNAAEIERLLREGALILAELDGAIVGSVNVDLMDNGVGHFGMLVADPNYRGRGIGSALVARAEDWARGRGCRTMRLELLTPRHWTHPVKEFLKAWYTRLGYKPHATEPLEVLHADLAPELATECDYTVWRKPL
ncbi:MAG TPA: GNAT family N-acetyltransferase [Steroidobacteraceae bacterium]|nr:GNAT family N-acetyltransferase [Steroidobacteraceae bacterium]